MHYYLLCIISRLVSKSTLVLLQFTGVLAWYNITGSRPSQETFPLSFIINTSVWFLPAQWNTEEISQFTPAEKALIMCIMKPLHYKVFSAVYLSRSHTPSHLVGTTNSEPGLYEACCISLPNSCTHYSIVLGFCGKIIHSECTIQLL